MHRSNDPEVRVVIDTNVWISALVFGGLPEQIIAAFMDGRITVVISEEILSELRRKIIQKFPLFATKLALLEVAIKERAMMVRLGTHQIVASRDPNDNMVIETAVIGLAGYIISGDKDLLVLHSYQNVTVVRPADFTPLLKKWR